MATHIYEKGPQTLTDVISEVEKLNATQQLTATIIPPSTAKVCQTKKIVVSSVRNQAILHEIALKLDAMSEMNMVTLPCTVHTEYLLQEF